MCTVKTEEETKRGHRGHHSVRNGGFLGREKKEVGGAGNIWSNTCHCGIKAMN